MRAQPRQHAQPTQHQAQPTQKENKDAPHGKGQDKGRENKSE